MSFLKRAIQRGVSNAISNAVGKVVQQAVEPAATELANQAAESIGQAAARSEPRQSAELEGALSSLRRSMESYATQAARNMKQCPACGEACSAEKSFCPSCGAKLPEMTLAQGAVCTACGKQNTPGTKFCSGCGAKLPAALEEEQAARDRDAQVLARWSSELPRYPQWSCGGQYFELENTEPGWYRFAVSFGGNIAAARQAVERYRQLALQSGFRMAGQYPSMDSLYSKADGVCYYIDTGHCFDGDPDCVVIGFGIREPEGGFEYVKPEPRKKVSLRDLFDF